MTFQWPGIVGRFTSRDWDSIREVFRGYAHHRIWGVRWAKGFIDQWEAPLDDLLKRLESCDELKALAADHAIDDEQLAVVLEGVVFAYEAHLMRTLSKPPIEEVDPLTNLSTKQIKGTIGALSRDDRDLEKAEEYRSRLQVREATEESRKRPSHKPESPNGVLAGVIGEAFPKWTENKQNRLIKDLANHFFDSNWTTQDIRRHRAVKKRPN